MSIICNILLNFLFEDEVQIRDYLNLEKMEADLTFKNRASYT
jgi:hypothetical protein